MSAAREAVEDRHHIHGEWCICGFRSAVARDRTVHILDVYDALRAAVEAARPTPTPEDTR